MRYVPSILIALCGAFFIAVPLCIAPPVDSQTRDVAALLILLGIGSFGLAWLTFASEMQRADKEAARRPLYDGSRGPRRTRQGRR